MDFDPRDDDSREDDRFPLEQPGRSNSYDDIDRDDDLRLPESPSRDRNDEGCDRGRGPGDSRQSNADKYGHDQRDDARWPDRDRDKESRQTFYAGAKRERELEHDVQVYRAFEREAERLEGRGARVERVVLDYELKRDYQKWLHERDRDRDDYDGETSSAPSQPLRSETCATSEDFTGGS